VARRSRLRALSASCCGCSSSAIQKACALLKWLAHYTRTTGDNRCSRCATQRGACCKKVDPRTARGPIRIATAESVARYRTIDFRKHPELYRVGRGEQGVLTVEPYKSELLPLWRFKNEQEAERSSRALYRAFVAYRRAGDFVGMDMARKFVQMGYTRARRYANHRSGRKYGKNGSVRPLALDPQKAKAAQVFRRVWEKIAADKVYTAARMQFDNAAARGRRSRNVA